MISKQKNVAAYFFLKFANRFIVSNLNDCFFFLVIKLVIRFGQHSFCRTDQTKLEHFGIFVNMFTRNHPSLE